MNVELQRVADNVTGSHLGNVGALSVSKSFDEFKEDSNHNIIGYWGSETDGAAFPRACVRACPRRRCDGIAAPQQPAALADGSGRPYHRRFHARGCP